MNENYLELNNIKKIYPNGFQAIFNLHLKIKKGEFVVFVGPSGCGKSTTIRMIAGLEEISSGEMILENKNATNLPARKRNISMVFQNYALFPHLTVKENIVFTLRTRKVPREKIEAKVKWAATVLMLEYLLNRKPAQLSGGQRQRVALGRAMVADSKLFLMDEPLSNLDAKLRGTMRSTIKKLHRDLNTTSIYVTHDQIEAMTMGDKIVVMSDGFIQQVGTPQEVFEQPANKFVAKFIGTPIINMMDGEYKNNKFKTAYGTIKVDKKILRNSKNKKYQVGFRPNYAKIYKNKVQNSLELNVSLIEILGAETILHTKNNLKIVVPTDNKPQIGDKIYVIPFAKKVILFDKIQGIALTSTINQETMQSLEIFYQSQKLVEARSTLMEKQKNKKINEGIFAKLLTKINNWLYPEFIILNEEYTFLKQQIREQKEDLHDLQRRKKDDQSQKQLIQTSRYQLNLLVKKLKSRKPIINKFKKIYSKIQKLIINLEKISENKNIVELKQIQKIGKLIKMKFKTKNLYNYIKINEFIRRYNNFIKNNKRN